MKEKMKVFILKSYPQAVLDVFIQSDWGTEYQFYPNKDADEPYTCIVKNGALCILTDF